MRPLTVPEARATLPPMADDDETDDLGPRESERARRRDRDLSAAARDLMRAGQAKVFKQVMDRQARRAADPVKGARPRRSGSGDSGTGAGSDGDPVERDADSSRRDVGGGRDDRRAGGGERA